MEVNIQTTPTVIQTTVETTPSQISPQLSPEGVSVNQLNSAIASVLTEVYGLSGDAYDILGTKAAETLVESVLAALTERIDALSALNADDISEAVVAVLSGDLFDLIAELSAQNADDVSQAVFTQLSATFAADLSTTQNFVTPDNLLVAPSLSAEGPFGGQLYYNPGTGRLYVYNAVTAGWDDYAPASISLLASNVAFTSAGNLSSTNVQDALQELDDEKLNLTGGTITGKLGIGAVVTIEPLEIYSNVNRTVAVQLSNPNTGASAGARLYVTNGSSGYGGALTYLPPTHGDFPALANYIDLASYSNTTGFIIRTSNSSGIIKFMQGGFADSNERMRVHSNGNLGIGVTSPSARLHVRSTTEQQRLAYDSFNYLSTTVGSNGATTFQATGSAPAITFASSLSATQSLTVQGRIVADGGIQSTVVTESTTARTLSNGDIGKFILLSSLSGCALQLNTGTGTSGDEIYFQVTGAITPGAITRTGTATVNFTTKLNLLAQGDAFAFKCVGTDVWNVI